MRKFLIYTSAGENSNVRLWHNNDYNRSYDIWVTNYSDTKGLWKEYANFYNESKGGKFANFKKIFDANIQAISNYEMIMLCDDDVVISPKELNALLQLMVDKKLDLLVPAFSRFGKISHNTTERRLFTSYRTTNFAEMTCPIFRFEVINSFMGVYDPALLDGHGVDWWYLNHMKEHSFKNIAISDRHYCINPHDFHKIGGVREITRLRSKDRLIEMFEEFKVTHSIQTFEKEVYSKEYKSILEIIKDTPQFLIECAFNFTIKLRPFYHFRNFINHFKH